MSNTLPSQMISTKKLIFTIIIWGLFIGSTFYLSGNPGLLAGIFVFLFYMTLGYVMTAVWRFISQKPYMSLKEYAALFSYRIALFMTIIGVVLGGFCVYQNEINPAYLPRYTLTDGKKTIIFQTMAHIGSDHFYETVKTHLTEAKKTGYVLYYEGVRSGTKENNEKFNRAMGMVFDKSLYANISKLYGLREQRNDEFLGIVNNKDENVDITIDDIVTRYEKRLQNDKKALNTTSPVDVGPIVNQAMKSLTPEELKVINYLNQSLMNLIMKSDTAQKTIISTSGQADIFDTILHDRNEHLANAILTSKDNKIFILYGMLHFDGVLEILQKNSPDWHVERVEFEYPVR